MKYFILFLFVSFTAFGQISPNGKKSIEYRKVQYQLWNRLGVEYNKLSNDDNKLKKKIVSLIDDFSRLQTLTGKAPTYKALANIARPIIKQKPKDPLAKVILGNLLLYGGDDRQSDFDQAFKLLNEGDAGLAKSKYSLFAKMLGAKWLRNTVYRSQKINGKKEKQIMQRYTSTMLEYAVSETAEEEQRFLARFMEEFLEDKRDFKRVENFYREWQKRNSKCKAWFKELTSGIFNVDKAWHFRGGGYANTVTDEGFKNFGKYLKIAAEHFKKAISINPQRPEAAAALIAVSMGGGTEEPERFWFDKAVAAEVDFEPAYRSLLWAYRPRWGGSHQKMLALGLECVNSGLYDTLVPLIFIEAVKDIKSETSFDRIKELGLYDQMHEVLKSYEKGEIKRFRVYDDESYIKAIHFCFAYKLQKYSHVRKIYQLYGDSVFSEGIFKRYDVQLKPSVAFSYAVSGDASSLVSKIHSQLSWESNNLEKSLWRTEKELELLIQDLEDAKALTSEKESKYYFDKLSKITQLEKQYNSGEWVNLKFTKDLPAWKIYGGNWDIIDENTIQASNLDNQRQYLSSEAFFKPPYIVEVEVESIKSNWRGRHLQAGLILGRMYGPKTGRTFWADGLRRRSGIGIPNEQPAGITLTNRSKKNKITVYAWDGHHELYLNNYQDYYVEAAPKFKPLRVSIGIMPWYPISGVVKYSNFRIKKLNFGKAPELSQINERIAYFKLRADSDPTPYVFEKLADSYVHAHKYKEALAAIQEADTKWTSWWNPFYSGTLLNKIKAYDKVTEKYELALTRAQKSKYNKARILNSYAWFLATCPDENFRNGKKAVKLSMESLKTKLPAAVKGTYMDTLAASYAASGNFKKALETIKSALKIAKSAELKKDLLMKKQLFIKKKIYIDDEKDE